MKFKIPEIKIRKRRSEDTHDSEPVEPVIDDADYAEALDELDSEQPQQSDAKAQRRGMEISESQLRSIWAGEIGFGLIMALTAVIIALIN